ncbi:MAG: type I-U CRISPR-associated helicase/endonuclease Cas3 [Verrucomicrobia bacterium]|nr:type I-U CRISPR-associated helicase/endonuclease Cas3 [Verrucomicrobiota bacterium]
MSLPSFEQYFRAIWGYDPFPWQIRLARLLENGEWPQWITLPTGTGKTTALDIAIYALASQAHLPGNERKAPVRIVFAVNRRIVVDEAFNRAKHIAERLATCGDDPVLKPVADSLRLLAGEGAPPLEAYPLRGATYTDHAWTRSAIQPLVITTTLDQLGSRLLFRGYGCSVGARPMHAALLTQDSLLLLDEAHTSQAFSETLSGVARWRGEANEPLTLPFAAVQLTATPPADATAPFSLNDLDRADRIIAARLAASKPTTLVPVADANAKERHKKLAFQCETIIRELAEPDHFRRILIVVNRVATANQIREELAKKGQSHGYQVELLTGGLRPLDRDALIERIVSNHQLQSRDPAPDVPKLILVATQCVEVGADFDFDALITELCPLDSLRQRFGRLNRYGRSLATPAWILAPGEALESGDAKNPDPLYGTCLPAVWNWLQQHQDGLDLGLAAYDTIKPTGGELAAMLAPAPSAPILLPAHLDLLCQTSPAPHHEPEPALYIHGPQRDFPTVSVVLRAGLQDPATLLSIIEAIPPLSTEAATVQLVHARRWLLGDDKSTDCDAPAVVTDENDTKQKGSMPTAIRYADGKATPLADPNDLRSGDVLVLPVATPGLTLLVPGLPKTNDALDQAESAHLLARDKVLLALSETRLTTIRESLPTPVQEEWDRLFAPLREAEQARTSQGDPKPFCKAEWRRVLEPLIRLLAANLPNEIWTWAVKANGKCEWQIEQHPAGGIIARNPARVGHTKWPMEPDEIGHQGNTGDGTVLLSDHQAGVEGRVAATAAKLGLSADVLSALIFAARYHDIGKADPRFQAWLNGCSVWETTGKQLVAKSTYPPSLIPHYRQRSETPDGFRHELLSTLIVAASTLAANHPERDLLLHLIASHHGYCRACAPVALDANPESFAPTVEGETIHYTGSTAPLANFADGVPERFWKLTRRFGWWGLAYLETLLRIADQRESANPSNPTC